MNEEVKCCGSFRTKFYCNTEIRHPRATTIADLERQKTHFTSSEVTFYFLLPKYSSSQWYSEQGAPHQSAASFQYELPSGLKIPRM